MTLDNFTAAYVEAALWSTHVEEDYAAAHDMTADTSMESAGFSVDDIAPETLALIVEDCDAFRAQAADKLSEWSDGQAGHDFWLTRNRHGAGFWDRGLPFGRELTDLAHIYGESDLYIGDDGRIYA
jgi:hypothetical protein